MKLIDDFLNKITMYRLVLYILRVYLIVAIVIFRQPALLFSVVFLVCVGWAVNKLFAKVFETYANVESWEISAYILALIIKPPVSLADVTFLFWAAVLTMASKFILAVGRKHIFNPAAIALVVTALTISHSANWWIGTKIMLPFVLAGGLLIVRKIRRFDLFLSFIIIGAVFSGNPARFFFDTPAIFFATIMLTEPLTMPPQRNMRLAYGALVGFLFYSTPELALIAGNIFSWLVSPKIKPVLILSEKIQLAPDIWDFIFIPDKKVKFIPGQYLEWTLPSNNSDNRGNRRYFTLASSPTENNIRLGVKFYENSSTFKKKLLSLNPGDKIIASQLAGEFTLNSDPARKYIFLAGGIGITPFRSMIKYLADTNQTRDIILFYGDRSEEEFIYKEVLSAVPTHYVAAEHITGELIKAKANAPDFMDRYFYISGSHAFVSGLEAEVRVLGVPQNHIKTDFFPGFV